MSRMGGFVGNHCTIDLHGLRFPAGGRQGFGAGGHHCSEPGTAQVFPGDEVVSGDGFVVLLLFGKNAGGSLDGVEKFVVAGVGF